MNIKQLMKYFGVTERTVRRWIVAEDPCPYTRDETGRLKFDLNKVEKWRKTRWTKE